MVLLYGTEIAVYIYSGIEALISHEDCVVMMDPMSESPRPFGLVTREHAIAAAQSAMCMQGYAVAVHGSKVRDLDLLAVPWTEDTALTPLQVAEIIAKSIPGVLKSKTPVRKPHGRVAFVIFPRYQYGFDRWYIDLSIMPRKRKRS